MNPSIMDTTTKSIMYMYMYMYIYNNVHVHIHIHVYYRVQLFNEIHTCLQRFLADKICLITSAFFILASSWLSRIHVLKNTDKCSLKIIIIHNEYNICLKAFSDYITVKPPNKGHFGTDILSLVGRLSSVRKLKCIASTLLEIWLCREVVPFSEGPLLEVSLYNNTG